METESEPYVRLATLRQLHQVVGELNTARSLADTLQTVADGVIAGLGYELACVNLVRPTVTWSSPPSPATPPQKP
ncbi:hypothetical protein [Streptomyces violascens]|uniref:Uncharacterized protein n=1 Tax=Streptomyces violascens TaxID=67381 RepID=A0ABQ3QQC7_9ACTN|nr:hypothetical protein Sviol_38850 [Streptomyces violascens]